MRWIEGVVAIVAAWCGPAAAYGMQPAGQAAAQGFGPGGQAAPEGMGPAGPVELSQPWASPAASGGDASVMFTLHNAGAVQDNLLRATCATAESAELVGPAQPNGATTAHLDEVGVAAGQTVGLAPDGVHIVLHHLYAPAQLGETLHCTVTFAKSGERLFEAEIRQAAPPPAPPV